MRLQSESRNPGMASERHCFVCRELLGADDGDRCFDCTPHLSRMARVVGKLRRRQERKLRQLEATIRGVERAVRNGERDQRHR